MKIIVFSDSHGSMNYMLAAIEKERPDYILHLGDLARDAEQLSWTYPHIPLLAVCGNCDYYSDFPVERIFMLEGFRFYICHGHKLGVKTGFLRAELSARQVKADFLLFGHTHIPYYDETAGLRILNPGTCGGFGKHTYGLITIGCGQVSCELAEITPEETEQ